MAKITNLTIDIMRRRWPHGDQHIPGLIERLRPSYSRSTA
jgi:hypothetical protein